MTGRLSLWTANWVLRRQGTDPLDVTLKRRRIYILPTRFGAAFAGLVFAMLLGSINYGASLGFGLTFLLAGLVLVIMHHCHNNLLGAHVRFASAAPVFAGQRAEFSIGLSNEASVGRYELEVAYQGRSEAPVDLEPDQSKLLTIRVPARQRGLLRLQRFAVATRHPGNLFRAWTWIHMDARCLIYPEPAPPGRPVPDSYDAEGTRANVERDDADFAGLRTAVRGDPLARIAWKAYARSQELLLKQFASGDLKPHVLDWDALPELDTEARLSQLTRWCLDAAANFRSFGLRLPGQVIPLGNGDRHLSTCLRALALFEAP